MPEFWDEMDKESLCNIRGVCREFRTTIPDRFAIMHVFKGKVIKKADLFRILPLSVHDVLKISSPVDFTHAFQIAERKAGGFSNCMAMVRERGWRCWCDVGEHRARFRDRVESILHTNGVHNPPKDHPLYQAGIRKAKGEVVVWRYGCTYEPFMPLEHYNPYMADHSPETSIALFISFEYESILDILHQSVGNWYKGINRDVRSVVSAIQNIRNSKRMISEYVHVLLSNGVLMVGVVTFSRWNGVPPMENILNL